MLAKVFSAAVWGVDAYAVGIFSVLLSQAVLVILAFIALAISGRKSHFFFPLQQYKILIDEVHSIR